MKPQSGLPRVWFLSSSLEIWGAEQSLLTLGRHLRSEHVWPVLYASSLELVEEWKSWGCEGHYVPAGKQGHSIVRSARWLLSFTRRARNRPDVVVFFNLTIAPLVDAIRIRTGQPHVVLDLHDYLQSQRGKRRLRSVSQRFDKVIAISDFVAMQIAPVVPVSVITRPIERDLNIASGRVNEPTIGIIGRVDPDKHLEFALSVARALPDLRFEVRGSPSAEGKAYAMELQRSATANVVWIGRVPRSDVFSGLAVLFVPNHEEALGRTVLEAQLSEVPVVVPSSGGPAELVENGMTGYTYRPRDRQSAVDALQRALEAPRSLIQDARAHALVVSDPERYSAEYLRALKG